MHSVNLKITGNVQGVFFRATAKQKADELGIYGWVKNSDDGNVQIHAKGDELKLKEFIKWCKVGPKNAEVEKIEIREMEDEDFEGFKII